jgi:F-type H+-transporting ATPase subunit b
LNILFLQLCKLLFYLHSSYQSRKQELEDQKEAILAQAKEEAAARRKDMMDKARREIEENRSQWYSALQDNKDLFLKELSRRASEEIVTVSQLALRDLANAELEKQIITVFIDHIQKIEEKEEKELIHFAAQSQDKIIIRSSFKVPEAEGQKIRETIQRKIKASFEVRFVSSPELLCGIELMADGYKIGWSVATYLDALKEAMFEVFEEKT